MQNDEITAENTGQPDSGRIWWLAGAAGLLGICCLAGLGVFALALLLTPAVKTIYSSRVLQAGAQATATPAPSPAGAPSIAVLAPAPFHYPTPQDNSIGDPAAPVRIVEFGDFQCPYCARFWGQTEKSLISNYVATGKVFFTYRSVVFIGPESKRAGEAAYCAAEQDKFWQYHDYLFVNQGQENSGTFTTNNLLAFAGALKLDRKRFATCLSTEKYATRIGRDAADAAKAGVTGTPAFLIDGQLVLGSQSYAELSSIIDGLLNSPQQVFPPGQGQNGLEAQALFAR